MRWVEDGQAARAVAREAQTTEKTVRQWVGRVQAGEPPTDRSSRAASAAAPTPPAMELRVKVLRQRDRLTLKEIAAALQLSRATVARIVARCGW